MGTRATVKLRPFILALIFLSNSVSLFSKLRVILPIIMISAGDIILSLGEFGVLKFLDIMLSFCKFSSIVSISIRDDLESVLFDTTIT